MNNITTYQGLLEKKKYLESALIVQRMFVMSDVADLKEDWKPVTRILAGMRKLSSKSNGHPLMSVGIDLLGKALINKVLPVTTAGWLAGIALPLLTKGFSSDSRTQSNSSIVRQWIDRFRKGSSSKD